MIRTLAKLVSGRAWRRFEAACQAPEAIQAALWQRTATLIADAPFWRGRVRALEDMPLTRYDDYRAVLADDQARTTSSLNGETVQFWAESSGTTAAPKLFPMTRTYRAQFQTVNLPFVHGLIRRFPGFLAKKVLYLTSPGPTEVNAAGVGVGFISGYNYLNTPPLIARAYALPRAVLVDEASYHRDAALYALAADVGSILAVTPARVRLLAEEIVQRKDELLARLPSVASAARVAHVRRVLDAGELDLKRLWPALEVVGAWKTSACALQLASLDRYLDASVPRVDVIYSATEGWVNVPFRSDASGGPVHPGAMICEFLSGERLLKPWQLTVGEDYEIVITNMMGLVRYRLFDVVRCTGFFHRSPIVEFVGKAARELIVGMMRVSEAQLVAALATSPLAGHLGLVFAPRASGDGIVLWARAPIVGIPSISSIDARLRELNAYYRADVASGILQPLTFATLPADHPLWSELQGGAQAKPRIYVDTPLGA